MGTKSFYAVGVLLGGGGAVLELSHTYGRFTDLQRAMEFMNWTGLQSGQPFLPALTHIPLITFLNSRMQQEFDLKPHVTVHAENGETFCLADTADDTRFLKSARVSINWAAVPLIPLVEPVLQDGEIGYYYESDQAPGEPTEDDHDGFYVHGIAFANIEGELPVIRHSLDEATALDPAWLTYRDGVVRGLAEKMHETGDYFAMPILADALQDAGCTNELILWHCRSPVGTHAHGSWLVERIRQAQV